MDKILIAKQKYSDFDSEILPHLNSLKYYAERMTRDLDDSKDLVQETIMKAFRFLDGFKKGSNAKAWLLKIMQNSFINNYRERKIRPQKVDFEEVQNFYEFIKAEDILTQHSQDDAFNNVLNDEIYSAISLLPNDFRTIVYLCDIEGYSYKEISEFMDCPIGTVRSRLHRSRKMLYSLLYEYALENGYAEL